jgi:hypothetical protein
MRKTLLLSIVLLVCSSRSHSQDLLKNDFEAAIPCSPYLLMNWEKDGFIATWEDGIDTRSLIDSTQSVSGRNSLRITYPEGQRWTFR